MTLAPMLDFRTHNGFLCRPSLLFETWQHHEFELRLRDAERLLLYVQSGMAEREMQSASLKEAKLACRRLELEAKESAKRASRAEAERDAARHEAAMAKLEIEEAVNTQAQMESKLTRVQRALAVAERARLKAESEHEAAQKALSLTGEACTKAEEENNRFTDERLSLIFELGTIKDDFAALRERLLLIERQWRPSLMQAAIRCSTMAMVAVFYTQHMWEQASDPEWNVGSFNLVNSRVLC